VALLDTLTNAPSAAYSSRKLRSGYAGSAWRVRESDGNTEQNIGFSGDDLDVTSLLSFVGSNDGFLVTEFDQTTNGRDLTQATNSKQPKVVSAGSLITIGGRPGLQGVNVSGTGMQYLEGSAFITGSDLYSAAIFKTDWTNSSGYGRVVVTSKDGTTQDFNDALNACLILRDSSNNSYNGFRGGSAYAATAVSDGTENSLIAKFDGTNYTLYKNNSLGSQSASSGSFSIRAIGVFEEIWALGSVGAGVMGELIIGATLTDSDRGKIYQSQGEYFLGLGSAGIGMSNLKQNLRPRVFAPGIAR
jgi:hypothetical protein